MSSALMTAPMVLEELLVGPCKALLPQLSAVFRRLLKGARMGRPVELMHGRAAASAPSRHTRCCFSGVSH